MVVFIFNKFTFKSQSHPLSRKLLARPEMALICKFLHNVNCVIKENCCDFDRCRGTSIYRALNWRSKKRVFNFFALYCKDVSAQAANSSIFKNRSIIVVLCKYGTNSRDKIGLLLWIKKVVSFRLWRASREFEIWKLAFLSNNSAAVSRWAPDTDDRPKLRFFVFHGDWTLKYFSILRQRLIFERKKIHISSIYI